MFLSFACTTIYAQVKENNPGQPIYANGDSYGFYIDEIPGAISYEWSVMGYDYLLFPVGDRLLDIIFLQPGYYDVICTVTMSDYTEVIHATSVGVSAP